MGMWQPTPLEKLARGDNAARIKRDAGLLDLDCGCMVSLATGKAWPRTDCDSHGNAAKAADEAVIKSGRGSFTASDIGHLAKPEAASRRVGESCKACGAEQGHATVCPVYLARHK
jgi:hypothetical protein